MRKVYTLLLLLIFPVLLMGQEVLMFKPDHKVKYLLTYIPDSTSANKEKEIMLLFIGQKKSKFLSEAKYSRDSIFEAFKKNALKKNMKSLDLRTLDLPKSDFDIKIYKDIASKKTTTTEKKLGVHYNYEEPIDQFKWSIHDDKKTIEGYDCQKATTHFAGRDYVAWFTTEIPIPDGPYKFYGLPGLIVELADTKNDYIYELISFNEVEGVTIEWLEEDKEYLKVSKQKYIQLREDYDNTLFERLSQRGISLDLDPAKKRSIKKRIESENNPIELEQ